jgi:hypothetical protein
MKPIAAMVACAPALAHACPACVGAQRGFSPLHLALLVLPFVIGFFAVRAILRALDE